MTVQADRATEPSGGQLRRSQRKRTAPKNYTMYDDLDESVFEDTPERPKKTKIDFVNTILVRSLPVPIGRHPLFSLFFAFEGEKVR